MTPEDIVKEMAKEWEDNVPYFSARKMLRVVLKVVQDGEVVELSSACHALSGHGEMEIVLKPDFQKFMEEK